MADEVFRDFPLMRELSEDEQNLLQVIWDTAFSERYTTGGERAWQTWDFVWRSFAREHTDSADPDAILAGLPTVARPGSPGYRYGLVWWFDPHIGGSDARIVGLSIAGLMRLAEIRNDIVDFADGLAQMMVAIAKAEISLPPVRGGVAQDRVQLSDLTPLDVYTVPSLPSLLVMTPLSIGQALQQEYMPASITPTDDGGSVVLGWIRSRSFADVSDAKSYVAQIAEETQHQRDVAAVVPSPFGLAQTLDYLSLVLEQHPGWGTGTHLVDAPDLQSVVCLGQRAETLEDFQRYLGIVWNLINRLKVPKVPDEALDPKRPAPPTLDRIAYWLETHVGSPLPAPATAALRQIRDVGLIREGVVHNATRTRSEGDAAAVRLGIATPILSGELAWATVQTRLADAFNTIRESVRPTTDA